jgi:hypothetical protein
MKRDGTYGGRDGTYHPAGEDDARQEDAPELTPP